MERVTHFDEDRIEYQAHEREPVKSAERRRQSFVISARSSEASGPRKRAFDNPSPGQKHETLLGYFELHDNQVNNLCGHLFLGRLAGVAQVHIRQIEKRRRDHQPPED